MPSHRIASRRTSRGSVIIEATVTILAFAVLLFGVCDVAFVVHQRSQLQYAVTEAGRRAMVKSSTKDIRAQTIMNLVRDESGLDIPDNQIDVESIDVQGNRTAGPGQSGDVVTIKVHYDLPLLTPILGDFFPGGKYPLDATVTFQNEEFNAGP